MRIAAYIHPPRTYLPCSGVGRHINGVLAAMAARPDLDLSLLFRAEFLGSDGRLPANAPLRSLPSTSLTGGMWLERCWKVFAAPALDRWLTADCDWVYAPTAERLPARRPRVAITEHDAQVFEPWEALPRDGPPSRREPARRWWLARAMRDADLVFTVSGYSRARLVDLVGLPPEKVVVTGNGLHPDLVARLAPPPDVAAEPERDEAVPPYALSIGGLRHMKGGAALLAVARALARAGSPFRLRVAGVPNDRAMASEAAAIGNVDLLGKVSDAALHRLLAEARALLFLSPYEGFGIPAIEAMALDTPVISSDRAALPEVVGEAGFVLDPAKTDDVIDALMLAWKDAATRKRLITAGHARAATFTWERVADRVVTALSGGPRADRLDASGAGAARASSEPRDESPGTAPLRTQ